MATYPHPLAYDSPLWLKAWLRAAARPDGFTLHATTRAGALDLCRS